MGEEFEVTIEKGKTLTIKTLTPGIEVGKFFSYIECLLLLEITHIRFIIIIVILWTLNNHLVDLTI